MRKNRPIQVSAAGDLLFRVAKERPSMRPRATWPNAELRQALLEFKERFNELWLLERHGYATPAQVRTASVPLEKAA
ncbi:hypothetical protein SAMN02745206_01780 [Desulfacinum infernum DSM 9756]|uniref:Uncharacterized protein n=1 Tax=Desulfacinum infernum DSM 9756 TaxID=1121391 RepID=A0A1M5ATD1_9BACT|nr:hypothetical protein SAMN02745206_01780 [Desulfacinum infernum DSM 9756]